MDYAHDIHIRTAAAADAEAILAVYAPYIRKTAITFEYEVPSPEEFQARITSILKRHPYLVAEREGGILGYAYTHPFIGRAASDWSAEVTIYLREDACKLGLGRRLYQALEDISRAQNILNLNASIAVSEAEDPYVTRNSAGFHAHMGYRQVAEFHKCGYKFGRWYNLIWVEKFIGAHTDHPAPVIPFPELSAETLQNLGIR
ncbi:MAG: GNAT family N-acetyltransferase [Oscillospiraceae bacterium]|nr:GNAT family N-acetyltransferase [Oscillospiraceae bacterium]